MKVRTVLRGLVIATILAMLAALLPQMAAAAPEKRLRALPGQGQVGGRLRRRCGPRRSRTGARVLRDLRQINTMVVNAPAAARSQPGRRPADPRRRPRPAPAS